MFADRYFGKRYFGNRYFGPGAGTVAPAEDAPRVGGFLPIIYLDKTGKPVDIRAKANQAVQAAKKAVKELPKEDRADAKDAIRALRMAVEDGIAEHVIEQTRLLSSIMGDLKGLLAEIEQIARTQAEEDDAIAVLLLMA